MVAQGTTLADLVRLRGRFHRSAHLTMDREDTARREHYVVTPTVRALALRVLDEVRRPGGTRAWSLTGPYGSGKSSFALFLSDVLTKTVDADNDAHTLRAESGWDASPFLPILVVGQRSPLRPLILAALASAVPSLAPEITSALAAERNGVVSDEQMLRFLEQAVAAAKRRGKYGGLLFVIDEFGKCLEFIAQNPTTEDLQILQLLAEYAARSPLPIVLITILHMAFAEYFRDTSEARRAEWQKVQGRFLDVAFQEPAEQLLTLVGSAIERKAPLERAAIYRSIVEEATRAPALAEARRRIPGLPDLLPQCVPLHPITALLLWPLFRSKLAQNERSLFSFLTSSEPDGFQDFLSRSPWQEELAPLYRVDHLYDYVSTAIGLATFLGDHALQWSEIDHALARIEPSAPPLASAVVKTAGLLMIYGRHVGLKADDATLAYALMDTDGVTEALTYLQRASILVYRRFEQAYWLWEGSDINIDARYEEARQHISHGDLAQRLEGILALRPIVARAHYIRTGTLRYFSVQVIDADSEELRREIERDPSPADGKIIYVLGARDAARAALIDVAKGHTATTPISRQLTIVAFPKPIAGLEEAMTDIEAWQWVRDNVSTLQGDRVARKEIDARIQHARAHLHSLIGNIFGLSGHVFDPGASEWVQGGEMKDPVTGRAYLAWLSRLCDDIFSAAPTFHNELLNRRQLSSAAAKARRELLIAMLTAEDSERLGLAGYPPEVTMYETLLATGGFHQYDGSRWRIGSPGEAWQPIWQHILAFFKTTHTGRRAVKELYRELQSPPFGLREGYLPVLLLAALLANRESVALYENSLFQAEWNGALVERLQRLPEAFEIQQYALSAEQRHAFDAIATTLVELDMAGAEDNPGTLIEVAKPLITIAVRLNPYARNTRRNLSAEAIALRSALLDTKDPYRLLFAEIPAALRLSPEADTTHEEYRVRLQAALIELRHAYLGLLDDIEQRFRSVFQEPASGDAIRQRLQERAAPLVGHAAEPKLETFIREAASSHDQDWREVLGRAAIGGKPTTHWRDPDFHTFCTQLDQLASDFVRVEEVVQERLRTGSQRIFRIGVLNGHLEEMRSVIGVPPHLLNRLHEWEEQITTLLMREIPGDGDDAQRLRLAAIAAAAERHLKMERKESDNAE